MFSYKDKIKKIRKDGGLSQTEFANKTGVSRSYIAQIELGNKNPSLEYLENVIKIFDLNRKYFFTDDNENIDPSKLFSNKNKIEFTIDVTSIDDQLKLLYPEIEKYYHRLIDVKMMLNKIRGYREEENLVAFIEEYAIIKNKYFKDHLFSLRTEKVDLKDSKVIDIRALDENEKRKYIDQLLHDRRAIEYAFFEYFRQFYNKYMESWYKGFYQEDSENTDDDFYIKVANNEKEYLLEALAKYRDKNPKTIKDK